MSYLSEYSGQLGGLVRITIVALAGHLRLALSALSEIPGRSLECSKHHPGTRPGWAHPMEGVQDPKWKFRLNACERTSETRFGCREVAQTQYADH